MLIKRIKATNYKTYLKLDLDLSVEPDQPIVLVGGANGGGKTTLFDAIYNALYGIKIKSAAHFRQLLNAGAIHNQEEKISLELHFSGKVLNQEQQYVLTRTYILNTEDKPVESVKLNMDGSIFQYGTATPHAERQERQAQVDKIIKANLPEELSRYFLFDAMTAGDLLKEDQLNRVIKENIENVMGFNKYLLFARASESLFQEYTAQRLKVENEKQAYLELVTNKKDLDTTLQQKSQSLDDALQYSLANQSIYENQKQGLSQQTTIQNKINQTLSQIDSIKKRDALYLNEAEEFIRNFETHIALPKLATAMQHEVALILKVKDELLKQNDGKISPNQLESIASLVVDYLTENNLVLKHITTAELVEYIVTKSSFETKKDEYAFLEQSETKAIEDLVTAPYGNPFSRLTETKRELTISLGQITTMEEQVLMLRQQASGNDYTFLTNYEQNESLIKRLQDDLIQLKSDIEQVEKQMHKFDIQNNQEPDPKYETLQKLKPFFENVANQLLANKKTQIESRMKQDLNINLAAYKDVIDRVELSEDLKDLSFKIYHKAGNEIYLNHLNTASKQVVVQVLLKVLHEFGDYDPPVMIDTVMGVLDETSRATVLENYFPSLSHQTILLSSDSEIKPGKDFDKISPFISKVYTLVRDRELQLTEVVPGYFGKTI